ncbi:MAG: hypothetical protein R3253_11790 [Longimicrobiales bacterium]|nr:hypothetical protein [Longimicrobiales bacterium]
MLYPTLAMAPQAATGAGALAAWANVAIIVIAVAVLVLALMAGSLMLRFNRILSELQRSAHQNFGPVSDRARSISDNVEFITQALRTDVEKLNASVRALSDRLQQASDRMEERIEEFNALMEVVQVEAEEIFIDTASTVRGVREGARAITRGGSDARPRTSRDGRDRVSASTATGAERTSSESSAGSHPPGPGAALSTDAERREGSVGPVADGDEVPQAGGSADGAPDPHTERAAPPADPDRAVRAGED